VVAERGRPPSGELDRDLLNQVRILGDDGFRRVIDRYLETMPERLDQLATALDTGDLAKVGSIAHQMVGESGLVGLRRVEHLAREIELAARAEGRLLDAHLIPLREAFSRGSDLLLAARDEPAPAE
jgi:HPt (histidine-containing phosphotransfer) domain-containing protein